jgi:integrase
MSRVGPGKQITKGAADMPKLTKRVVDAISPMPGGDVFGWDAELRGFGVRVKPSGVKSYLVQYRNAEGRTRRLVLGQHGALTPEEARRLAQQKLAAAARGEDPSAERHAARSGMTVAEVCDWYLEQARKGQILGRNRRPIKQSTLDLDEGRINAHIKPLIGSRMVRGLTLPDIERVQADILAGKTAKGRTGRGGLTTGGSGAASRTIGTLRGLLAHATRWKLIERNPAEGVRQIAGKKRDRRLSATELNALGQAIRDSAEDGEHPTAIAAIRFMLLTGFRRMEALGLRRQWVDGEKRVVRFPDTKSGPQVRAIGESAIEVIESQSDAGASVFVFPADHGSGHFIGVVRVLDRICTRAALSGVTPHVLRHTFASIAGELGFSELTIAALLGHSANGVTQRYIHIDEALAMAADKVSAEVAGLLDQRAPRSAETRLVA